MELVLASLFSSSPRRRTHNPEVDKEKIDGSSGCNSYGGKIAIEEGTFKVRDIQSTAKGCKGDVGQWEEAYLRALRSSASYQVQDSRLEKQDAAIETTLVYEMKDRNDPG